MYTKRTIYRLETPQYFWNFTDLSIARKFGEGLKTEVKTGAEFKEVKEKWNGKRWVRKERVLR